MKDVKGDTTRWEGEVTGKFISTQHGIWHVPRLAISSPSLARWLWQSWCGTTHYQMHKCLNITFSNKIRNYDPATDEQILTSHMLNIPALDGTFARLTCRLKLIIFYSRGCFEKITFGDCLLPHNTQSFCQLCISNNTEHRLRVLNTIFGIERKQQVDAKTCTVIISTIFTHPLNTIRVKKSRIIRWTGLARTYKFLFTAVLLGRNHQLKKREHSKDISVEGRKVVRLVFNRWWYEADSSGSGQGPVTCSCEAPCYETLDSIKGKEYREYSKKC